MYCHNCGKQIPDSASFCTFCGARQGTVRPAAAPSQPRHAAPEPAQRQPAAPQAQPAQRQTAAPRQQQKPKKKRTGILIPVLVFFIAGLLGRFVIAPAMQKGNDSGRPELQPAATLAPLPTEAVETFDDTADTDSTAANQAYTDVFAGSGVIHLPILIAANIESFALKDEEGDIDCIDYGYQGDQVTCYAETWYYLGVTSDQQEYIQNLTNGAEQEIAKYSGVACIDVTYSYEESGSFFKIRYNCTGLDQPENLQAMYDLGLISSADGISMSLTEQEMLAQGYVKR